jgi:hypothetical protein
LSAPGIRHPTFGTDCDINREPQLCSLCDAPIAEDDVPLQLFGGKRPDGDVFAWVYCDQCSVSILTLTTRRKSSPS